MNNFLLKIGNTIGKGRLFKLLFNISPMYRSTGGRLIEVNDTFQYVKLKLPLNYRTKNYVGTLYGGHMYSCVDGIYMVQLINILGKQYVVWDKSAIIKFKRPGNKTLYAEFNITDNFIDKIKYEIEKNKEKDFNLMVYLKDSEGKVYAEVEKTIYIAYKDFFKEKQSKKLTKINLD